MELGDTRRAPQSRGLWIAVGLVLVAGGAGIAYTSLDRDDEPRRRDATRRPTAPPAGAFAAGGIPGPNPAVHEALSETLPDWVIALDRMSSASREKDTAAYDRAETDLRNARATLLAPDIRSALGGDTAQRLDVVLDRAVHAASIADEDLAKRAADEFLESVGALNDSLAASGHGFFIDGDVLVGTKSRRIVLLYSFRVAHVRVFRSGTGSFRALQLRRIDRLNWTHRLLGFTSPHLREALVLLDQVDELLVNYVLPAMAPGASVELIDSDSHDDDQRWQHDVSARAGEVIRAEYGQAGGFNRDAAIRIGRLLAGRRDLFDRWKRTLARRGFGVRAPRTLRLEGYDELLVSLKGSVPRADLDELERIERELVGDAIDDVFGSARDVIIASVERHEVQHRIDAALTRARPVPAELEALTGPRKDRRGQERQLVTLSRDELSAYLAELARDPVTPRVNLTLVARFLFDRERWGTAECYAAVVIFEGLAAELDIDVSTLVQRGKIDRPQVARIYLAVTDKPVEDLRAASLRLWERLFDTALPPIEIVHNDDGGSNLHRSVRDAGSRRVQ